MGKITAIKPRRLSRVSVWAAMIILGYVALALAYSVINPLFEAPDEWLHYQFIRYLVEQRALPVQTPDTLTEYQQPPLYYATGALLTGALPADELMLQPNPFWGYDQYRFGADNKVQFIHTAREVFPYQGTVLVAHILRGYSIFLGVLTLLAGWQALQLVLGRSALALSALAVMAWNPQFTFVTASINNDNLAAALGAALIWWSVLVLLRGVTWKRAGAGGLLLGALLLTKVSAAALALVMLAALAFADNSRNVRLKTVAGMTVIAAAVSGWWFVRNWQLYGELTGVNTMLRAWGTQTFAEGLHNLGAQLSYTWTSYWGRFGIGQIVLPDWSYGLIAVLGLLCLLGLVRQMFHPSLAVDRRGLALLALAAISTVVSLIVFALVNPSGANGRYLFPAATAFSALLVYGWRGLYRASEARFHPAFALSVGAALLVLNVGVLWGVVTPAYALPAQLDLAQVRQATKPDDIRFDQTVRLLGHALDRRQVQAGAEVLVKLCWQVLQPTTRPVAFFLHVLGAHNAIVGTRTSFHGLSRYPSVDWQPDHIFCDDVPLKVNADAVAGVYDVEAGLIDLDTQTRLPAFDATGAATKLIILDRLKIRSELAPAVPAALPEPIDFGGQFKLLSTTIAPAKLSAGNPLTLTLYWQAAHVPDKDFTVFVHVLDAQGQQIAGADSMPQANHYPTSYWDANEIVPDAHRIELPPGVPPGEYQVAVGWYDLASGARLPVNGDPAGALTVGKLEIAPQ